MNYEISQLSVAGKLLVNTSITRGMDPFSCGNIDLQVVGPTTYLASKGVGGLDRKKETITSNSISATFLVKHNGSPVAYLAGDIDRIGLDDLMDHKINFSAPLLVFPHHGGKSGAMSNLAVFTQQICDVVKPSTVVFSIGRNKHDNPRIEIVSIIRKTNAACRIACTQLSKQCAVNLPLESPKHLVPMFSRGRSNKECCAGTFVIDFAKGHANLPSFDSHRHFIMNEASSALCIGGA